MKFYCIFIIPITTGTRLPNQFARAPDFSTEGHGFKPWFGRIFVEKFLAKNGL